MTKTALLLVLDLVFDVSRTYARATRRGLEYNVLDVTEVTPLDCLRPQLAYVDHGRRPEDRKGECGLDCGVRCGHLTHTQPRGVTTDNAPSEEAASTAVPVTAKTTGDDRDAAWTLLPNGVYAHKPTLTSLRADGGDRTAALLALRIDRRPRSHVSLEAALRELADGQRPQTSDLDMLIDRHAPANARLRDRKRVLAWTLKLVDAAGGGTAWRLVGSTD